MVVLSQVECLVEPRSMDRLGRFDSIGWLTRGSRQRDMSSRSIRGKTEVRRQVESAQRSMPAGIGVWALSTCLSSCHSSPQPGRPSQRSVSTFDHILSNNHLILTSCREGRRSLGAARHAQLRWTGGQTGSGTLPTRWCRRRRWSQAGRGRRECSGS